MTETTSPAGARSVDFADPETRKRLKKRRAAELRFQAYGVAAIGVAVAMLLLLVTTIGSQALTAFSHHKVAFELDLAESVIAPDGRERTDGIAENVSGFNQLVRANLAETFPVGTSSPRLLAELNGLVTRLALLPMARDTARHPARIGTTHSYRAALSDDLDLYLKGRVTDETVLQTGRVTAASERRGTLRLDSEAGAFAGVLEALDREAGGLDDEARSVLVFAGANAARVQTVAPGRMIAALLAGSPEGFDGQALDVRILELAESERNVTDAQIAWTRALIADGRIERGINWALLTNADSTYPEIAGVLAAIIGSLLTMLVTALLAIPVGIAAAIYLEELAPKNRATDAIELNINNLAAIPSIVFGLLGAAVFLNLFGLPRSAPLVGGLVLGLLTLPTVIIASRAALRSVPPSIRAGALALGASKTQSIFHHVLPLAAPGILTGAIIGMARALGETAPLLLIGMVAFVAEVPGGPTDEATALPVLVYKWSTGAERAWEPMTAAAIMILLTFMVLMNAAAVFLRRRLERRW